MKKIDTVQMLLAVVASSVEPQILRAKVSVLYPIDITKDTLSVTDLVYDIYTRDAVVSGAADYVSVTTESIIELTEVVVRLLPSDTVNVTVESIITYDEVVVKLLQKDILNVSNASILTTNDALWSYTTDILTVAHTSTITTGAV